MRTARLSAQRRSTWGYRFSTLVFMTAFFGGDLYLLREMRWLEATFDAAWLVLGASVLGIATYMLLRRPLSVLFVATGEEAWAAHALMVVGLMAGMVAGASHVNRRTAGGGPEIQSFEVLEKKHEGPRPRAPERWEVMIAVEDERESVAVRRERWDSLEVGTMVELPIVQGGLGFSFVARSTDR